MTHPAVEFLQQYRPSGHWLLFAIKPDAGRAPDARCFSAKVPEAGDIL
jgi:hypothetical protein